MAGVLPFEAQRHRRPVVGEVAQLLVLDLAALAADEQAGRTYPGEILVAGEIENAEPVAEIELGDELFGSARRRSPVARRGRDRRRCRDEKVRALMRAFSKRTPRK